MLKDPARRIVFILDEFKKFAFKGNLIDLAIAVVIGAAFTALVDSFVKNIIMPTLGLVLPGEKGFAGWQLQIGQAVIPYGNFIGELVKFLIISFVVFLFMVKFLGWLVRSKKEAPPPALTKDQQLLTEIRDLLAKQPLP